MHKKYFEGKKAVFFDLDGTVIDSIPMWKDAFMVVLDELGYLSEARDKYVDRGAYVSDIWKYIKKYPGVKIDLSIEELKQKTHKAYLDLFNQTEKEPREGFWGLVSELKDKGIKLALVSNGDAEIVNPVIEKLDIKEGVFDLIVTGNQVKHRKPKPDVYKKALKELGLNSKEVLCFEDSVGGSMAAKKAGLDTIAIWDGEVIETDYPRNVMTFLPDFSSFPGNLDTTYMEHAKKGVEYLEQEIS